jgi:hypothetical protein
MAKRNLTFVCWICGLILGVVSIPSALAQAEYTYMFTANPGQVTWYNGTTVEIQVQPGGPNEFPPPDLVFTIVSLDFHGVLDLSSWAGDPPQFGPAPASLTPFSFSDPPSQGLNSVSIAYANAYSWQGALSGYGSGYTPLDPVAGTFLVSSYEMFWGPDAGGTGQPIVTEYAQGTWSLVPDAGSSFELLATAMAALAAGRLLFGGWPS